MPWPVADLPMVHARLWAGCRLRPIPCTVPPGAREDEAQGAHGRQQQQPRPDDGRRLDDEGGQRDPQVLRLRLPLPPAEAHRRAVITTRSVAAQQEWSALAVSCCFASFSCQ